MLRYLLALLRYLLALLHHLRPLLRFLHAQDNADTVRVTTVAAACIRQRLRTLQASGPRKEQKGLGVGLTTQTQGA